jgi:hypothetical protein
VARVARTNGQDHRDGVVDGALVLAGSLLEQIDLPPANNCGRLCAQSRRQSSHRLPACATNATAAPARQVNTHFKTTIDASRRLIASRIRSYLISYGTSRLLARRWRVSARVRSRPVGRLALARRTDDTLTLASRKWWPGSSAAVFVLRRRRAAARWPHATMRTQSAVACGRRVCISQPNGR